MADLHFREMTSDRFLDDLVAKVNAQKADAILIGGDILEGDGGTRTRAATSGRSAG